MRPNIEDVSEVRPEPTTEHCLREVERVMLFIADAQRRCLRTADELEQIGADSDYVEALRESAAAMRREHDKLLRSTHFRVPQDPLPDLPRIESRSLDEDQEQQRMAI